jgi:HD domain
MTSANSPGRFRRKFRPYGRRRSGRFLNRRPASMTMPATPSSAARSRDTSIRYSQNGRVQALDMRCFRAVTGHHGRPPREFDTPDLGRKVARGVCIGAASAFTDQALAAIDPPPLPRLDAATRHRLAWFLTGLAVAADWLGSGRRWFQPVTAAEHQDLYRYWHEIALPRARQAASDAGLLASPVSPARGLVDLFPGMSARPLQSWSETVPIPEGPVLFTIEDATGSGKTEAALVLAHRLMCAGRADGLFFALPTMATANAMYARLENAYRRLFALGSTPSLVLSHGRRSLHEGFTASILDGAPTRSVTPASPPSSRRARNAPPGLRTIAARLSSLKSAPARLTKQSWQCCRPGMRLCAFWGCRGGC